MLCRQMMKINLIAILILGIIPSIAVSQQFEKDTIKLFFLGGQSNMEGHGKNAELQDALKKEFNNVWIFQGNPVPDEKENGGLGIWDVLTPGHGAGFSSDGNKNKLSNITGVISK